MALTCWSFAIEIAPAPDGWRLAVVSRERLAYGPFPTERDARLAEHRLIRRWGARAVALGGHVQRLRADRWCVALPDGVVVRGGRLLHEVALPCSTAGPSIPRRTGAS